LEGFRRLNTVNGRLDKSHKNRSLNANGFLGLSEREIAGRSVGTPEICQRDGWHGDAPGPFPSRRFAQEVAAKAGEVRDHADAA
jgi:hypothetical protein